MDAKRLFPNAPIPFWAKREFRWLLIFATLTIACLAVLVFEIGPLMRDRRNPRRTVAAAPAQPGPAKRILFDGMLEGVRDATPLPAEEADAPYRYLLGYLRNVDEAALARQSRKIDYGKFFDAPGDVRGQVARIDALLIRVDPFRSETGGDVVYRAYLVDGWASDGYVMDLIEKPSVDTSVPGARPSVQADGVFLKVATYESGRGAVQVPFLLGRSLRPLTQKIAPAGFGLSHAVMLLAGLAMAAAMGLTVLVVRRSGRVRYPGGLVPRGGMKSA